jgi:inorganic pyrophosphatase
MKTLTIVIETPRDSREKYNYDPEKGIYYFKKALPLGMIFPHDFGFIPQTKGEDGDPLDAMVISEFKTFPGCRMECKLIGALTAQQSEEGKMIRNDRFFFTPKLTVTYQHIETISDLPKQFISELIDFFVAYNKAGKKEFEPLELIKPKKAWELIMAGKE